MLRIREFSTLGRVTVKALHLYDRLGLLPPAHIDAATGYRFYTLDQLPRLNRILALKDLGCSLQEIQELLDAEPAAAALHALLERKRSELEQQLADGRMRLTRVHARLHQIARDGTAPAYDVAIKSVDPMTIASARAVQATHERFVHFTNEVPALVYHCGVPALSAPLTVFYKPDEAFIEHDFDVEVAVPVAPGTVIAERTSGGWKVRVRELGGWPHVAYLVWDGREPLRAAYAALGQWIADNGYYVAGPAREVYLRAPAAGPPLFELQYPLANRRRMGRRTLAAPTEPRHNG